MVVFRPPLADQCRLRPSEGAVVVLSSTDTSATPGQSSVKGPNWCESGVLARTGRYPLAVEAPVMAGVDMLVPGVSTVTKLARYFGLYWAIAAHAGRGVASDLAHLHAGVAATADVEDSAARVLAFLRFFENGADELMSEQSGCLYATVLAEREFTGSAINSQVANAELAWRTAVAGLLRPALAARRPDVDVDALADHLFTTFEGGFILCRTLQDPSAMKAQLRVFRQLVEALLRVDSTTSARSSTSPSS